MKITCKSITFLVSFLILCISFKLNAALDSELNEYANANTQFQQSTKQRACWIPNSYIVAKNATSVEGMKNLMMSLQEKGINRIYLDVWNQGQVYFHSKTWESFTSQKLRPELDYLGLALASASEISEEIEIFAWFEYGLMTSYGGTSTNKFAMLAQENGWVLGSANNFDYMDPRKEEVLTYLSNMIGDSLSNEYKQYSFFKGVQVDDHFSLPTSLIKRGTDIMEATFKEVSNTIQKSNALFSVSPGPLDFSISNANVDWNALAEKNIVQEVVPQLYRTSFKDFKSILDTQLKEISSETQAKMTLVGLRVDGSGASTPWDDVEKMIQYANMNGIDSSIWYANGILTTYPMQFEKLWGSDTL